MYDYSLVHFYITICYNNILLKVKVLLSVGFVSDANRTRNFLHLEVHRIGFPTYPTGSHHYLTPWRRGFLEKFSFPKLVKEVPVFYGNNMFITTLTKTRHMSLS